MLRAERTNKAAGDKVTAQDKKLGHYRQASQLVNYRYGCMAVEGKVLQEPAARG